MLRNLGSVKKIVFIRANEPLPELKSESMPLLPEVLYIKNSLSHYCTFHVPTSNEAGSSSFQSYKIPKSIVIPFADKNGAYPVSGTVMIDEDKVQRLINVVRKYVEQEKIVSESQRSTNSSHRTADVLSAIVGGSAGVIGGEILEKFFDSLNNIDNNLPVPFWMFTASVGIALSFCYKHYYQESIISPCLNLFGKFGRRVEEGIPQYNKDLYEVIADRSASNSNV